MNEKTITVVNDLPFFSGIGQYTEDIINLLLSNDYKVKYVSYYPYNSRSRNLYNIKVFEPFNGFSFGKNIINAFNINLFQFHRLINVPAHITNQFLIPLGINNKNVAITIHDLNQLHKTGPNFISTGLIAAKLNLISRYKKIVVDSTFVKNDILNHFRIDENLISVIYNWIDISKIKVPISFTQKKKQDSIKLLHVGNDQPNKNIDLIYKLLTRLPVSYQLIRVGTNTKRNMRFVEKNNLLRRVKFYERLPKKDLDNIYNSAHLFIYPSFNEGFGRPLLEAMAHGLPAVYRNSSSLPEIAGNTGVAFDNDDLDTITEMIQKVVEGDSYTIMAEKSIERSKYFDINHLKGRMLEFYDELFE